MKHYDVIQNLNKRTHYNETKSKFFRPSGLLTTRLKTLNQRSPKNTWRRDLEKNKSNIGKSW
jgi:hypothetical protein